MRWIAAMTGLGLAAVAFWLLLGLREEPPEEIDAASRAELERVLDEADGQAERP